MKNLIKLAALLLLPLLFLSSCKEDAIEPAASEFQTLTDYMIQNDLDLPSILNGWVKAGSAINVDPNDYSVPDYFVIDLRNQQDFDNGHIKNAVRADLPNILDIADQAAGKPILVVCYTGQTAARAVGALRLMKKEAYSLKWGMSAWHSDLAGKWTGNAGDFDSPNWLTTGDPTPNAEFIAPTINTGEARADDIMEARIRTVLNKPWTIAKTDVLDNPESYFINNKWPIDSWNAFGHIRGAYRIDEDLNLNGLKFLDPGATIVTYCYTGQTSAITTVWLDVLGYNGRSLMFGANGIAHSKLVGSAVDGANKKSWRGEGSGSQLNYGYYDAGNNLVGPL